VNSSAGCAPPVAGAHHQGVPKGILLYRFWREHLVRTLHRDGGGYWRGCCDVDEPDLSVALDR